MDSNDLTKEDWIEIYYCVKDKLETPLVQSDPVWRSNLKKIIRILGIDAWKMYDNPTNS